MAKTKKEMRKAQANYAEIIMRKNKYIKELQEKLIAWDQVNRINQALVAAVLQVAGAEDKSVDIKKDAIDQMLQEYTVQIQPYLDDDGELDGYIMQLQKREAGE